MIRFRNVSKSYRAGTSHKQILTDATFTLPWRNIAILGVNGAGKSTLIRMLAGSELPDDGDIRRDVSVSWPLGFDGGFHGSLSGIENLRFICRIYDRDMEEVSNFVAEFAELGRYLYMPIKTYSSGMRARLAFALSMAIDFDTYLIDEIIAVGDASFKAKCHAAFRQRRARSRVIMVSHAMRIVRDYCDMGLVMHRGRLTLWEDVEDAIAAHQELIGFAGGDDED